MCGIYGAVSLSGAPLQREELVAAMGDLLYHRGPDSRGELRDATAVIGLQRLRIVDLHERADQPFTAAEGRIWLACNGEIYNERELRSQYVDYPYRSHSDVETILPLYLSGGSSALASLDGMFAVAVWDGRERVLTLCRDRAGEKPLFFARVGDEIWFASEVQPLLEHPDIDRTLDLDAIDDFLRLGYVLQPRTMFRGIRRIEAGTIVRFHQSRVEVETYWKPAEIETRRIRPAAAIEEVAVRLEAAIERQVRSDVPVGVFASGGLDSSLIVHLTAERLGHERVRSFSVRFPRRSYDESPLAERFAAVRHVDHLTVNADDDALVAMLRTVIDRVAEPIADPAILPTALLARKARETVTVVFTGEGADELFGGYPTYLGHRLIPWLNRFPPLRAAMARIVRSVPPSAEKMTVEYLLKRLVDAAGLDVITRHVRWFGTGLPDSISPRPFSGAEEMLREIGNRTRPGLTDLMLLDYRTYLRDNLLVKLDRATMLASVESRAPFLDSALTEFAVSLPENLRLRRFNGKWVLKKAAERWLSHDTIWRRKRGLSVPVAEWINGCLREEVDRVLDPDRLRRQGLIDPETTARVLAEHRSGHANNARGLWALFVLELWLERWMPEVG